MTRFWQEIDPALYAQMRSEVEASYPTLHFEIRLGLVILSGSFPISDAKGLLDYFLIEVEIPARFPRELPIVREIGNRIPRIADRHMIVDGRVCLFVEEDWWWSHPSGYTLLEFLDGPVRNFFVGQSMVERGLEWPFGERSHTLAGVLETYAEITGAPNLAVAQEFVRLLALERINGHHKCPCGSGKKLRYCHQQVLLSARSRIPWHVSRRSWQRMVAASNGQAERKVAARP